jgi:CO/xanthine dehydrogenase FAD-binding subunit
MIPFDFEYYLPGNAAEAVTLYSELAESGRKPLYYAGGTEVITFCRRQVIAPAALIDLKAISEMQQLTVNGDKLIFGANLNLSLLSEQTHYPLLARVAASVADRTIRNRLTLGGNICGQLPYREAVMPFLLAEADLLIAGTAGERSVPLQQLFDRKLRLEKGEILLQLIIPREITGLSSFSKRREKHGPVDYPLCHLAALKNEKGLSVAVSGLCAFPFRSLDLEKLLNDSSLTIKQRAAEAPALLPAAIRKDELGSAEYRQALWQQDLVSMLEEMGGAG